MSLCLHFRTFHQEAGQSVRLFVERLQASLQRNGFGLNLHWNYHNNGCNYVGAIFCFDESYPSDLNNKAFMDWLGLVRELQPQGDSPADPAPIPTIVYRPEGHSGGPGLYKASGADHEFFYPTSIDPSNYRDVEESIFRQLQPIL